MAVVKNLMVRAGADFSGLRKGMQSVQKEIGNFKNSVGRAISGLAAILGTISFVNLGVDATKAGMQVESAVQQINRAMGSSAKAFMDWGKAQGKAYNLSKSNVVQYGAIYSNLLSTFSSSTAETMKNTQDLLKASAVVASGTGRSMEDVMDRIRSGLLGNTEAIEDLGINVNVAMIESTDAFKRFAGDKSWDQLDFKTQQLIRYYGILEQANQKFGDSINVNTSSNLQKFSASMSNAKLALGQAFIPALNAVLPALTAFGNALTHVFTVFNMFTRALFGYKDPSVNIKTQTGAVTGLSGAYQDAGAAAEAAGKAAERGVAGFDQLNQLSEGSSTAGSGAGNPLGASTTVENPNDGSASAYEEISAKVQATADKVKDGFRQMKEAVIDLGKVFAENKEIIIAALAGIAAGMATAFVATNWTAIIAGIRTAVSLLAVSFEALWVAVTGPIGLIAIGIAALVAAFIYFYTTNETFRGVVDGILKAIGDVAVWLWQQVLVPLGQYMVTGFVAAWKAVKIAAKFLYDKVLIPIADHLLYFADKVLVPLAYVLGDVLVIAWEAVSTIAKDFWNLVLVPLGDFLRDVFHPLIEALEAVFKFLWETLKGVGSYLDDKLRPIWEGLGTAITWVWDNVLKPVVNWLKDVMIYVFHELFKTVGEVIADIKQAFIGFLEFITGIFTGDWGRAWNGVKDVFAGVFNALYDIAKWPLNRIIDMVNILIDGLNKLSFTIPDIPGIPGGGMSFGINIPKIPKLKRGGFVDGETNMGNYVAGEAGRELVVPLENTSFTDKIASAIGSAIMNAMYLMGGNNKQGGDMVFVMDGTVVARVLNPYIEKETTRLGSSQIVAR